MSKPTKEYLDKISAMSPEDLAKRSSDQLHAHTEKVDLLAKSSDPALHLTLALTSMAMRAYEVIRSGEYDPARFYVGIALPPEEYVLAMSFGQASRQRSEGVKDVDTGPDELAATAIKRALMDASIAHASNSTGPSSQEWGGIKLFPDPRARGVSMGIFAAKGNTSSQTFNQEVFNQLQRDFETLMQLDAREAAVEKLIAMGTVPGMVGQA